MTAARPRPATEAPPVLVFLPVVPPSSLSPNSRNRTNWRSTGADSADVLGDCLTILKVVAGDPIPGPVSIDVLVCWPKGRRRPDCDALATLTKHHVDALVRGGVLPDGDGPDAVVRVSYRQTKVKDPDAAGVVFVITREQAMTDPATSGPEPTEPSVPDKSASRPDKSGFGISAPATVTGPYPDRCPHGCGYTMTGPACAVCTYDVRDERGAS